MRDALNFYTGHRSFLHPKFETQINFETQKEFILTFLNKSIQQNNKTFLYRIHFGRTNDVSESSLHEIYIKS